MATVTELETCGLRTMGELVGAVVDKVKETNANPVLYDLGCGRKKALGFMGVDFYYPDADVKHNLISGDWSFAPDNSVDMFYSSHFFEHVADQNAFMDKAWRKLRHDGLFLITTPYGLSERAWQDPDHKRPIFRATYWYFNKQSRINMGVQHYEGEATVESDFDVVQVWPVWNKDYAARAERNPDLAEQFLKTFNAVDDLTVLLRARKLDVVDK